MKRRFSHSLMLSVLLALVGSAAGCATHRGVCPDRFKAHVELLAHDELKGRGTGDDGIDLAAGYIAGQLAAAGVSPGGPGGTYFQEFDLQRGGTLVDDTSLRIVGLSQVPRLEDDFMPFGFSGTGEFSGPLVFGGYGITNPEKDHDDYAGVDVSNKVVLVLRREPSSWRKGGRPTRHARFARKLALAEEHGAKAMLVVNRRSDRGDSLTSFNPGRKSYDIPIVHITRDLANRMFQAAGMKNIDDYQDALDQGGNASSPLSGLSVDGIVAYKRNTTPARNVIGLLKGNGDAADEYVVIGGHYDHLGVRNGKIYNGADDNASGTAAIIESAYDIAAMPRRDRSVIFIAFTAEEIGLHGSRHFVNSPTVPIERIVAMLNMDMIGRVDHDDPMHQLAIQGLGTGSTFEEIVERKASTRRVPYIPDPSALAPSDHSLFYRAGVPSLFFFTGIHEDYHRPGDDIEKVNLQGALQITELVASIARELINAADAPVYAEVSERAKLLRGKRSTRPRRNPPTGA